MPRTRTVLQYEGTHDDRAQRIRGSTIGRGDFFGEVGIATGRPGNANVVARDAVTGTERLGVTDPGH